MDMAKKQVKSTASKQEEEKVQTPSAESPAPKPQKTEQQIKQSNEPPKIYSFIEGVKKAKEFAPPRKFKQTWDLAINLKGLDLKKPENRFNVEFLLPAGRGKSAKVGIIADSLAAEAKKEGADVVIKKEEIDSFARDKKKLKQIANEIDWFYGEITLMAAVGKSLGAVLGPRGKVPKPIPPKADVGAIIKRARNTVRLLIKESPVIHVSVGTEEMKDDDIIKNIDGVYTFVKEKFPKGVNNIRSMYLKLTMGSPVKLEVK